MTVHRILKANLSYFSITLFQLSMGLARGFFAVCEIVFGGDCLDKFASDSRAHSSKLIAIRPMLLILMVIYQYQLQIDRI